jgi:hypothetical protein
MAATEIQVLLVCAFFLKPVVLLNDCTAAI